MATAKRISGDYSIVTINPTDNVYITTNTLTVSNTVNTVNVVASGVGTFSGNVTAGNVVTSGAVSATGNITAGVFIGDGSGLTGIPAGNALGNIISSGTSRVQIPGISSNVFINVAGVSNIAVFSSGGANILGNLDITGNASTGNILSGGFYFANGQPLTGSVKYDAVPVAPAGPNPGDFWFNTVNGILYQYCDDGDTDQWVDQSGIGTPPSVTGASANTVIQRDAGANATANVYLGNAVLVTGNIQTGSGYFIGDGSYLTNINTQTANIKNGTSTVEILSSNGNILANVNGTTIGEFTTSGLTLGSYSLSAGNILNTNANGVGNIGSVGGYFNRVFATATTAQYADLAEIYESDQEYEPGTVVIFGGNKEITLSTQSHDPRVAGVISTDPAYLMNSKTSGLPVALTGKTPCKVQGPVLKGDRLVASNQPGVAAKLERGLWQPGCIIGKSLEDIGTDTIATINVAIGRF